MRWLSFAALTMCLAAPRHSSAQLINGGFETGPDPGAGVVRLSPGSTAIAGWTVMNATVDYLAAFWQSSEGSRSVDLDGDFGDAGALQQTFATIAGQTYTVTFDMAGNPDGAPAVKTLRVSAAGQSADFTFDITGRTHTAMGWTSKSWTFTASSASTTLVFESLTGSGYGPVIDNVNVVFPIDLQAAITPLAATIVPGQSVQFQVRLSNLTGATGVTATISLSGTAAATLTPVLTPAAQAFCSPSGLSLICGLTATGTGEPAVSFLVGATASTTGAIVATVNVTENQPDPSLANNQASAQVTVVPPAADVGIVLSQPAAGLTGKTITITMDVFNLGPQPATAVAATLAWSGNTSATLSLAPVPPPPGCSPDAIVCVPPPPPPAAVCMVSGATFTCAFPPLAPGQHLPVSFLATPTTPGTLTVAAAAAGHEIDPTTPNTASGQTVVTIPKADIKVTIAPQAPPGTPVTTTTAGQTVYFRVEVSNVGPQATNGLKATLALSGPSATLTVFNQGFPPAACVPAGTGLSCAWTPAIGSSDPYIALFQATPATPGSLTLTVNVTANEVDPDTTNNTATATVTVNSPGADVTVAVTPQSPPGTPVTTVPAGRAVTFRVDVSNLGPLSTTGVKATLALSGGGATLSFFNAQTPIPACVPAGSGLSCAWTPALGSTDPFVAFFQTTPATPGTLTLSVNATANETDPNPANNAASASVTVTANTPAGTGVTTSLGQTSLTFANVTTGGNTVVRPLTPDEPNLQLLPPGFALFRNLAFDISTTAVTSGPIDVRFNLVGLVPPDPISPNLFSTLRVLHGENGILTNRTVPPDPIAPPDPIMPIFARVTSLSPFVIAQMSDRLVFTSNRDGNFEIYSMASDGTGTTRLTNQPASDILPAWSPNRARIAFASNRDGNFEIYLMNADGSSPTRLTVNARVDGAPAWSPDGSKIAFTSSRDGNFEIYVINTDGTGLKRLTNHAAADTSPTWSPTGARIAFSSNRSGLFQIYSMNADGSGVTRLTNASAIETSPAWSPDGKRIVFSSNRSGLLNFELYVMNADGSSPARLTNNPADDVEPSWSPDGEKIVFTSNRDGFLNPEIYVMSADGSSPLRLTASPTTDMSARW